MKLLLATLWHGMRPRPIILKIDHKVYRWARLLCGWLEELSPEISQRAGFQYDLGWLRDLGEPDDTEPLALESLDGFQVKEVAQW